jgi:two-component system chemotaxis sensor kinase CheA
MDIDPELLKKLLVTFTEELNEQCQVITDGLLKLEKNEDVGATIEAIFRSAHNIKGAARGVGVKNVGEIAHHIESLFANIQNKSMAISRTLIDLCLASVDNMRLSLTAFIDKSPLPFDIDAFLFSLQTAFAKPTEVIAPITTTHPESSPASKKSAEIPRKEQESIRVSIDNLDRVSALTEEIQVTKIAIDDDYAELSQLTEKAKQLEYHWNETGLAINTLSNESETLFSQLYNDTADGFIEMCATLKQLNKDMHRHMNNLDILSNSLLEEVRMLRLIPATTLFNTLPRAARDIAHALNKEVELKITGDPVKMDKMVLESLQDPIIHLLRNAIDHGIEEPAIRQAQGKPAIGNIKIDVREQGSQILIDISDDGAGINLDVIANTAIKNHLITVAESKTMSSNEILELIFRPGFSTKETITNVSGRGIGLDVVKANLKHLKGHIKIKSELNNGTTFHLSVPLTLASERGLLIQSGGQLFVIPTTLIERVLMLRPDEIIDIEASQAILFDKHPVPLRTLADVLGLPRRNSAEPDKFPIIVFKKGWHTIALLVEDIINEREIVIKRLQPPLTNVPCIAGGTLAGNGKIIIVLNTNDLIDRALKLTTSSRISIAEQPESVAPTRPHILVVDDSITTRTLEKNILENKNYQVTVAVNGKDAWDLLQNQRFSLLITDVNMPIMDGFALTERVKKSSELRDMPVIIVTSLGSDAEKKRGIDVGADAYIVKNEFESAKLLQIVEQLV